MQKISHRYFDIDLLRFLAALSVVFYHYTFRGYSADNLLEVSYDEISFITKYGYLGVVLFFMISGFVILLTSQSGSVKKFLISRFTRLYPTFWVGVLFSSVMIYLFNSKIFELSLSQFFINLTMVPYVFDIKPVDGVYWTLLVELKFYFLMILVLIFRQLKHINILLLLWVTWSIFFYFTHFPYTLNSMLFPTYASYFVAGATFFLIKKEGLSFLKVSTLILSFVASCLYSIKYLERQIEHFNTDFSSYVVLAILFSFYLVFLLIALNKTAFFNKQIFYYLGILTYPLYLIHQNVGYLLLNFLDDNINKYLLLSIVISFMFLVSYIINYFIDNKLSKYLKIKLSNLFLREQNVI